LRFPPISDVAGRPTRVRPTPIERACGGGDVRITEYTRITDPMRNEMASRKVLKPEGILVIRDTFLI
jgi:hypothetical protein